MNDAVVLRTEAVVLKISEAVARCRDPNDENALLQSIKKFPRKPNFESKVYVGSNWHFTWNVLQNFKHVKIG